MANYYPLTLEGVEVAAERSIYLARESAQKLANALDKTIILSGGREYGNETFQPLRAAIAEAVKAGAFQ